MNNQQNLSPTNKEYYIQLLNSRSRGRERERDIERCYNYILPYGIQNHAI